MFLIFYSYFSLVLYFSCKTKYNMYKETTEMLYSPLFSKLIYLWCSEWILVEVNLFQFINGLLSTYAESTFSKLLNSWFLWLKIESPFWTFISMATICYRRPIAKIFTCNNLTVRCAFTAKFQISSYKTFNSFKAKSNFLKIFYMAALNYCNTILLVFYFYSFALKRWTKKQFWSFYLLNYSSYDTKPCFWTWITRFSN